MSFSFNLVIVRWNNRVSHVAASVRILIRFRNVAEQSSISTKHASITNDAIMSIAVSYETMRRMTTSLSSIIVVWHHRNLIKMIAFLTTTTTTTTTRQVMLSCILNTYDMFFDLSKLFNRTNYILHLHLHQHQHCLIVRNVYDIWTKFAFLRSVQNK
jgi:hypothetical protein